MTCTAVMCLYTSRADCMKIGRGFWWRKTHSSIQAKLRGLLCYKTNVFRLPSSFPHGRMSIQLSRSSTSSKCQHQVPTSFLVFEPDPTPYEMPCPKFKYSKIACLGLVSFGKYHPVGFADLYFDLCIYSIHGIFSSGHRADADGEVPPVTLVAHQVSLDGPDIP